MARALLGVTATVSTTGSYSGSFTGSFLGDGSRLTGIAGGSTTGSYNGNFTGTFSGTYVGDGNNLTNVVNTVNGFTDAITISAGPNISVNSSNQNISITSSTDQTVNNFTASINILTQSLNLFTASINAFTASLGHANSGSFSGSFTGSVLTNEIDFGAPTSANITGFGDGNLILSASSRIILNNSATVISSTVQPRLFFTGAGNMRLIAGNAGVGTTIDTNAQSLLVHSTAGPIDILSDTDEIFFTPYGNATLYLSNSRGGTAVIVSTQGGAGLQFGDGLTNTFVQGLNNFISGSTFFTGSVSGSAFTGAFKGDASGLTNVPAATTTGSYKGNFSGTVSGSLSGTFTGSWNGINLTILTQSISSSIRTVRRGANSCSYISA